MIEGIVQVKDVRAGLLVRQRRGEYGSCPGTGGQDCAFAGEDVGDRISVRCQSAQFKRGNKFGGKRYRPIAIAG